MATLTETMSITERLTAVIAVLLVLKACSLILFGRFISQEVKQHGWKRRRLKAAVALEIQELGNLIIFIWVLVFLVQALLEVPTEWMRAWPLSVLGGLIAAFGILYKLYLFAPMTYDENGRGHSDNRGWIASLIAAVLAAIAVLNLERIKAMLASVYL